MEQGRKRGGVKVQRKRVSGVLSPTHLYDTPKEHCGRGTEREEESQVGEDWSETSSSGHDRTTELINSQQLWFPE